MSELIAEIKKEFATFNEKKKALTEKLKQDFPKLFKPLFEESGFESVGWTQYTPWFMDGETCVFGVNTYGLFINEEYEEDVEDWEYNKKHVEAFREILDSIPDEFYLDLFGDHVQVTMYADGRITTTHYEHD